MTRADCEGYGRDQVGGDERNWIAVMIRSGIVVSDNAFALSHLTLSRPPSTRLGATMSEDTRNWRPFMSSAANKLHNFKGYLTSKDPRLLSAPTPPQRASGDPSTPGADPGSGTRQSWSQWAGEKLRRNGQAQGNDPNVVERVSLFPGWAARRLHRASSGEGV